MQKHPTLNLQPPENMTIFLNYQTQFIKSGLKKPKQSLLKRSSLAFLTFLSKNALEILVYCAKILLVSFMAHLHEKTKDLNELTQFTLIKRTTP